jgi:hypothetical protein
MITAQLEYISMPIDLYNTYNTDTMQYTSMQKNSTKSMFFTICIQHCYLPACFMTCDIVPLIKNKSSDLTDIGVGILPRVVSYIQSLIISIWFQV